MKLISPTYINVKGRLLDLATPQVMGILNVTPDSFYSGSRMQTQEEIAARARQIIDEGASIIDIGAYSSRPNAEHITAEEEMNRLTYRTGDRKPESSGCYRFGRYFPGGCSRTVCGGVWRSYRQ